MWVPGLSQGPVVEQPVLLTAEPISRPWICAFILYEKSKESWHLTVQIQAKSTVNGEISVRNGERRENFLPWCLKIYSGHGRMLALRTDTCAKTQCQGWNLEPRGGVPAAALLTIQL